MGLTDFSLHSNYIFLEDMDNIIATITNNKHSIVAVSTSYRVKTRNRENIFINKSSDVLRIKMPAYLIKEVCSKIIIKLNSTKYNILDIIYGCSFKTSDNICEAVTDLFNLHLNTIGNNLILTMELCGDKHQFEYGGQ